MAAMLNTVIASLGPIPLTVSKLTLYGIRIPTLRLHETIQSQRVFADVRVDVEGNLCALRAELGERRHTDGHIVADASAFHDDLVGMLAEDPSS